MYVITNLIRNISNKNVNNITSGNHFNEIQSWNVKSGGNGNILCVFYFSVKDDMRLKFKTSLMLRFNQ